MLLSKVIADVKAITDYHDDYDCIFFAVFYDVNLFSFNFNFDNNDEAYVVDYDVLVLIFC